MQSLFNLLQHRWGPIRFVQVGAHDGSSRSPLSSWRREGGWTGLMIEPVPTLFEKLQRRFGAMPGMILENAAVATHRGSATFFAMRPLPKPPIEQYDMLGSFRKDVILKHRGFLPDIEDYILEMQVPCWPLMELIEKHDLTDAQILITDTEGYDHEILKTVDFDVFRPKLLVFEYKHLDEQTIVETATMLRGRGYYTIRASDEDAIGIHADFLPPAECELLARPLLEHDNLMKMFETARHFEVLHLPSGGRRVLRID